MTATTLSERVRRGAGGRGAGRLDRALGHPAGFALTVVLLLVLYGWTFVVNPHRVAPTKDPAYYTWRTEMLISERPVRLLEVRGAFDMFAGGYRVAAPVLGGFLRDLPGVSSLTTTTFLMTVIPVITALLLAAFAYRALGRDPLMFHVVAFGVASLYLTPPFVGYLDNVLCLLWLAAAVWFIGPARTTWRGRAGLFLFLLLSGFTHPTTLAIFCMFLGITSLVRLAAGRDLRGVVREEAPMLFTAGAAALVTLAAWSTGIWGEPASLSEAALPPPYGVDFFVERLGAWLAAMRPALNGPLFAAGVVALLARGRRAADDDLALVSVLWLAPLVGLFGFVGGLAYPYYRFFNTTLAWVLLVGIGAYVLVRLFLDVALSRVRHGAGRGIALLALAGVVAVTVIVATNFTTGFDSAKWNDPTKGWLSASTRADLDALRARLRGVDRPVVFVIDDATSSFQIWGVTKLAGNTSRYGLPPGHVDDGYLYLGSLANYLRGAPTPRGEKTYDMLTRALLADTREGVEASGRPPLVVVARAFNATGANVAVASGERPPPAPGDAAGIWAVHDGTVTSSPAGLQPTVAPARGPARSPGPLHLVRVGGVLALLLLPGALMLRPLVPGAGLPEALGMVPALAMALLTLAAVAVLSVARAPFGAGHAVVAAVVALGLAGLGAARARRARTG